MEQRLQQWRRRICAYKKSWHIAALAFTAAVYGFALKKVDGSRKLTTASWQEILDNFYPDQNSNAMRLAEREVVPNWDATMQADDVTKALNALQTFCWFKHGMDDHLPFFWKCDIRDVNVELLEDGLRPLDPEMNCSAAFVESHIVHGDDPRCVPWGENSLPSLSLHVDPMFDEYEVHSSSPMFAPLQDSLSDMGQRLAAIEARLKIPASTTSRPSSCEAIAKGCWYNQNASATLPDDFPCSCFDKSGNPISACRNHHWGLVQLCQPSRLRVTFLIFQKMPPRLRQGSDKFVEWFFVQMDFSRIAAAKNAGSGLYRSHLWLHEERMVDVTRAGSLVFDGLLVLCVVSSQVWFIGQALGSFIFYLPRNLCALLALKREEQEAQSQITLHVFQEHLSRCLVGKTARLQHVNHFEAIMEVIVSVFMVAGIARSIFNGGDHCAIQDCPHHSLLERSIAVLYVFLLDDDFCHGTAWVLLYITIVFACLSLVDRFRWLPSVILLCAARLASFLLAYSLLLCGAGILMFLAYGPRYIQFSSPLRSCSELFFLTCGMPMSVFDNIRPFQDSHSFQVAFALALYCLFMSIIGLNFFITIILDAYVQARDVSAADEQLRLMGDDFCRSLMQLVGLGQDGSSDRSADTSRSASAVADATSETDEAELQEAFMASER
ncbi:unnamed protein product [Symbiodinium necroappetens]|uniref:Polycystin cation channel PKD1/PKD2 domain-containing protein n=1 Tax=Symbiodinium necroappetens TaxID=1628268 RepID=A0A813AYI7_9DINO|nr:unnamed protein product [Symbiodinium necroappetens]